MESFGEPFPDAFPEVAESGGSAAQGFLLRPDPRLIAGQVPQPSERFLPVGVSGGVGSVSARPIGRRF